MGLCTWIKTICQIEIKYCFCMKTVWRVSPPLWVSDQTRWLLIDADDFQGFTLYWMDACGGTAQQRRHNMSLEDGKRFSLWPSSNYKANISIKTLLTFKKSTRKRISLHRMGLDPLSASSQFLCMLTESLEGSSCDNQWGYLLVIWFLILLFTHTTIIKSC